MTETEKKSTGRPFENAEYGKKTCPPPQARLWSWVIDLWDCVAKKLGKNKTDLYHIMPMRIKTEIDYGIFDIPAAELAKMRKQNEIMRAALDELYNMRGVSVDALSVVINAREEVEK